MTEGMGGYRSPIELKTAAKENLDGKWLVAIAVTVVAFLLVEAFTLGNGGNSSFRFIIENGELVRVNDTNRTMHNLMSIVDLIIGGPICFGLGAFFLKLSRNETAEFTDMFSGFSFFRTNFVLHLLTNIFTFLWALLLVVPGIIAAISYSMAYYIAYDNPGISGLEAIRMSKEMMYGHKMRFFEMWLGFLGWFILGVCTAGLGMLYAVPYYRAAKANFYLDLKQNQMA